MVSVVRSEKSRHFAIFLCGLDNVGEDIEPVDLECLTISLKDDSFYINEQFKRQLMAV